MPRKLVSFDWAIKKLLRSKANFGILEGFLSELLFDDITILEVLESESNPEHAEAKQNRVDLKVRNSNHEIIIIEVQYVSEVDYFHRILFETSQVITEHLKRGDPYKEVTKVISISILYFDLGEGTDYIYHGTTTFCGLHTHDILQLSENQKKMLALSSVEQIFPEYYLLKVKNFDDIAKDSLDEWIYFLKNSEIKEEFHAKGLEEARSVLDMLHLQENERRDYEAYQQDLHYAASMHFSSYGVGERKGLERGIGIGIERGMKQGIEQGIEQGAKQERAKAEEEKRALVKRLLAQHVDIDVIIAATGLDRETIERL